MMRTSYFLRSTRAFTLFLLSGVASCASAPRVHPVAQVADGSVSPADSTEGAVSANAEPVRAAKYAENADIRALANEVLKCKFNEVRSEFDWDCEAMGTWNKTNLFEADGADETILAMMADPNVRIRSLASTRDLSHRWLTQDKTRVLYLFARLSAESDAHIAERIALWISRVDIEALGLQTPYTEMSKSTNSRVRAASAWLLVARGETAFALEVVKSLVGDPDREVQRAAARALGSVSSPAACKFVRREVIGKTPFSYLLFPAVADSSCHEMGELVMKQILERTKEPDAESLENGPNMVGAVATICRWSTASTVRADGTAIGRRFTSETWGLAAIGTHLMLICGGQSAKPALQTLAQSTRADVAGAAQSALRALAAAKHDAKHHP